MSAPSEALEGLGLSLGQITTLMGEEALVVALGGSLDRDGDPYPVVIVQTPLRGLVKLWGYEVYLLGEDPLEDCFSRFASPVSETG